MIPKEAVPIGTSNGFRTRLARRHVVIVAPDEFESPLDVFHHSASCGRLYVVGTAGNVVTAVFESESWVRADDEVCGDSVHDMGTVVVSDGSEGGAIGTLYDVELDESGLDLEYVGEPGLLPLVVLLGVLLNNDSPGQSQNELGNVLEAVVGHEQVDVTGLPGVGVPENVVEGCRSDRKSVV